jgi:hypothetical protein
MPGALNVRSLDISIGDPPDEEAEKVPVNPVNVMLLALRVTAVSTMTNALPELALK